MHLNHDTLQTVGCIKFSPQVDLRRGISASVFSTSREAHIKNPNNKTVPEGVMQGLYQVDLDMYLHIINHQGHKSWS